MKKTLTAITICFLFFWTGRIISINQNQPITTYYEINDTLDCGDLELSFVESHLDSPEKFKERFGVESDDSCGEHKALSICISVTNKSDRDADLNEIFDFLDCGFESSTWASAVNPKTTVQINKFQDNKIAPGKKQKIWLVAIVNKMCFKESIWNHISEIEFTYVLTLSPKKIAVRLKV